jgi:uncharacterized repeat protein (TIGR03943 family)
MQNTDHSEKPMFGRVKVAILLGLSGYFVYNIVSGNLTNYINIRFAWLSWVAVALFAALGIAILYALLRGESTQGRSPDDPGHTPINWSILGFMALPLALGLLLPSQPLGASAVNGNISLSVGSERAAVTSVEKDPLTRNVLDWLRAFSRDSSPAAFDGEQADFIGFVYREPDFPENHVMVSRFTVACCVADASAIGLPIYWPGVDELVDGEWVRVQGTFESGTFDGTEMPVLQVAALDVVDVPEHPYLYP